MQTTPLTQQVNAVLQKLTADIKANKIELPSPPDILLIVRQIAENPEASASDIAELVKLDFNLSGRIIKVANCALFGSRHHVSSIKSAISRLGMSRVQSLIIGLAIAQNLMKSKVKGLEHYFNQTWQQSNHVGAISYVLAQHKTNIDPEKALLAGMVHNIGVLPLLLRLNTISELRDNPEVLAMVADVVIPKLYPTAGKLIMDSWNFSPEISRVAFTHQALTCQSSDSIDLNDIVCIAYQLHQLSMPASLEDEPTTLTASDVFNKFWPSWEPAVEAMQSFYPEIKQMQEYITS